MLTKSREKKQLYKNATSYIKQIFDATYHKTAAVQPPTSHLSLKQSKLDEQDMRDNAGEVKMNS